MNTPLSQRLARAARLSNQSFELSPIKGIELEASKIPGVVSLAQGIPNIPVFPELHDFVCEQIRAGKCDRYSLTNGLPELREEISHSLIREEELTFDPESEIIVTCGSIEAIAASLLALTDPGDEVILPSPTYASYSNCIKLARCTPRWIELDEDAHFDFHIESLERAITPRTRVLLFCLPNNPTSTVYSKEKLVQVLALAERHNLFLIVDEVYKDFYYESGLTHFSPLQLPGADQRTIRICSFSKAYSLTGWRVGFLCARSDIAREILRFHDAMVTCAPVASQYAAIAALRFGDDFLKSCIAEYRKRRDYSLSRMAELSRYFDYQVPKAGYFLFPRLKDRVPLAKDSRAFTYELLHKAKVASVYGSAFGPSGESHIRLNFGREISELEIAFDRIDQFLRCTDENERVVQLRAPTPQTEPRQELSESNTVINALPPQSLGVRALQFLSRRYLQKQGHKTVVFIGQRSRTLLKRACFERAKEQFFCKLGALSYNTPVGVALAVLGESAPAKDLSRHSAIGMGNPHKSASGRIFSSKHLKWLGIFLRSLIKVLFKRERPRLVFLEFAADTPEELAALLSSAHIDTLVITPSFPTGPEVSAERFRAILDSARCCAIKNQTLICSEGLPESWYRDIAKELQVVAKDLTESDLCSKVSAAFVGFLNTLPEGFKR
jgi:aminotransferase